MQLPEQCGGRDIALGGEGDATTDGMNGLAATYGHRRYDGRRGMHSLEVLQSLFRGGSVRTRPQHDPNHRRAAAACHALPLSLIAATVLGSHNRRVTGSQIVPGLLDVYLIGYDEAWLLACNVGLRMTQYDCRRRRWQHLAGLPLRRPALEQMRVGGGKSQLAQLQPGSSRRHPQPIYLHSTYRQ